MVSDVIFLLYYFAIVMFLSVASMPVSDSDSLILVHTLFRHGNRTIEDNVYDSNPYGNESYYQPFGYAELTNIGKRTEYKLGQALRERYNGFLDEEYTAKLIEARSTITSRTKMSMLLVMAGLFPPTKNLLWNDKLNWQPIPYNTYDQDRVISSMQICKNYKEAYKNLLKTKEIIGKLKPYQDILDDISNRTGRNVHSPKKAEDFYIESMAQISYGYPIEDWIKKYINELYNVTVLNYHLIAYTTELRKISAGFLIKKIIEDTENRIKDQSPTKMYLYSAHEKNVGTLLVTLGVFDDQLPSFGSYVLVEVHRVKEEYGFKFYYQNYKKPEPVLLKLPKCEEFCPIDKFKAIVQDYLPEDEDCKL